MQSLRIIEPQDLPWTYSSLPTEKRHCFARTYDRRYRLPVESVVAARMLSLPAVPNWSVRRTVPLGAYHLTKTSPPIRTCAIRRADRRSCNYQVACGIRGHSKDVIMTCSAKLVGSQDGAVVRVPPYKGVIHTRVCALQRTSRPSGQLPGCLRNPWLPHR